MGNSINPFTDSTAKREEAIAETDNSLAVVENVSDDETMVAVSDVGADDKYPARLPANLTTAPGDSVIVATAEGDRPFVTAVVNRDTELSSGIDVSDDGTVTVSDAAEIDFAGGISVTQNGDTATVTDDDYITDDYAYFSIADDGRLSLFQATDDATAITTGGYQGTGTTSVVATDTVYAPIEDDFWMAESGSNIRRYQTSPNAEYILNSLFILNDPFGNNASIQYLAWDADNSYIYCGFLDGSGDNAVGAIRKDGPSSYTTVWTNVYGGTAGRHIDYASDGFLYATDRTNGTIHQFDTDGNVTNTVSFADVQWVAVRKDQQIVVSDTSGAIRLYDDTLTQQASNSNPLGSDTVSNIYSTAGNGVILSSRDGVVSFDDSLSLQWARPIFDDSTNVVGVTPENKAIIEKQPTNSDGSNTETVIMEPDTGNEIYAHQRGYDQVVDTRTVVAPRPGAFPNEF
jgi:hypothetical protein